MIPTVIDTVADLWRDYHLLSNIWQSLLKREDSSQSLLKLGVKPLK